MMADHMLTTVDNPYSPLTEFDEWFAWDRDAGYHTLSFLGRMVKSSDDLSHPDQLKAIEDAIDEIVELNVLGVYRKVSSNDKPEPQQESV